MFDPTLCTEELRIEGVKGEFARAAHMSLEVAYVRERQHEDETDPLFIGHEPIPTKFVLLTIDCWKDGMALETHSLRTGAQAIEAIEFRNFAAELNAYANDLQSDDLKP